MRHEHDATLVATVCPVFLLMQRFKNGVAPLLRQLSFVPHQRDHPVKPQEHDRVVVQHDLRHSGIDNE